MTDQTDFDLRDFMPYLLNQAAEVSSHGFAAYYKSHYGMLRTEWRVLFHLGRYGKMTAKDICDKAGIHKTKVSRAVSALQAKRYLTRTPLPDDRRHETLQLTQAGQRVFRDLNDEAAKFDAALMADFSAEDQNKLRQMLQQIAGL